MTKKYIYKVSFDEKLSVWQNVDAVIVSDTPLTEDELNKKVKNYEYDEESTQLDWSDGPTRINVTPIYDYEETVED